MFQVGEACLIPDCYFSDLALKIVMVYKKQTPSHQIVTCFRHDIAKTYYTHKHEAVENVPGIT
jgi:hypothetical protein